jgi:UDPglucose--hexose-1-phosphate uridylyltransferase
MPGGLFELRRDPITGWWVAVVVDRAYDQTRFAIRSLPVPDDGACRNCAEPPGAGVRVRMLRAHAFRVAGPEAGTRDRGREAGRDGRDPRDGRDVGARAREHEVERIRGTPQLDRTRGAPAAVAGASASAANAAIVQPGLGLVADVGSWRTIVAPPRHHDRLASETQGIVEDMLAEARRAIVEARAAGATDYVQVIQNAGLQAGARTNHLCLDVYDLPQIPHRIGEEIGGSARYVIREGVCPYCRLVREEVASGERLVFEDAGSVAFAPYASRSPFEVWVVPRQHQADFGLASDAELTSAGETLRKVLRLLDALDGPPYNLILHTAPLRQRVDETYHWHWEIHPRLREIAGLELGTGLPVNPISPETAVDELRSKAGLRRVEWPE